MQIQGTCYFIFFVFLDVRIPEEKGRWGVPFRLKFCQHFFLKVEVSREDTGVLLMAELKFKRASDQIR